MRLSFIDKLSRKRKANNQRTSGRPSTTDNKDSLPFSCSLPSRSFHLFAPNEARELVCKYFLSYLPDKDHSRSDPPHRQHVFQSSSFVSSFPNFVPVHYAVRRAASWLIIQWFHSKSAYLQYLSNMNFSPRSHHPFNGNRRSAARGGASVSPRSR